MKNIPLLLLCSVCLWSCTPETPAEKQARAAENAAQLFADVLGSENLPSEFFLIDNSVDNILSGQFGTKIRINKNTFVDGNGNPVTDSVKLELKEALFPAQWVMANLQTKFNGKPLETGGMVYLNATSGDSQLAIAASKAVQVMLPTDSVLDNMSLFEGNTDSAIVEWRNPVALAPQANIGIDEQSEAIDLTFERAHNVMYSVLEFSNIDEVPDSVQAAVARVAWAGTGLRIARDTSFEIDGFTVNFFKQDELTWHRDVFSVEKGQNSYIADQKTSYIFSMNKLGWANIDRLLEDPRTQDVQLLSEVTNHGDFDYVYITMLTERMYLPGYQKKDNSYSFTHGDDEAAQLPVGAKAMVMATAYKGELVFFAYKTITIQKEQAISLELAESDLDQIEFAVASEI